MTIIEVDFARVNTFFIQFPAFSIFFCSFFTAQSHNTCLLSHIFCILTALRLKQGGLKKKNLVSENFNVYLLPRGFRRHEMLSTRYSWILLFLMEYYAHIWVKQFSFCRSTQRRKNSKALSWMRWKYERIFMHQFCHQHGK